MNNQIQQFQRELQIAHRAKEALNKKQFTQKCIDVFEIGFCPSFSSYSFDFLNGRIVLPLHGIYGEPIAFAGRRLEDYSKEVKNFYDSKYDSLRSLERFLKWKQTKWVNTPYVKSENLFNLHRAKKQMAKTGYCFVVEGYYDVMRLYDHGFENVVALCGTNITNAQCDLLYRYCDHIITMFDGDDAGKTATNRVAAKARSKRIFTSIIELPSETDPDELTKKTLEIIYEEVTKHEEEVYIKL